MDATSETSALDGNSYRSRAAITETTPQHIVAGTHFRLKTLQTNKSIQTHIYHIYDIWDIPIREKSTLERNTWREVAKNNAVAGILASRKLYALGWHRIERRLSVKIPTKLIYGRAIYRVFFKQQYKIYKTASFLHHRL